MKWTNEFGVELSLDEQGHEHRGKGEGGGQFTSKGKGGDSGSSSKTDTTTKPDDYKGTGTREDPIRCGGDIALAARLLAAGKHIRLKQPEQVSTLIDKMSEMINEAMNSTGEVPDFDLCKVTVKGSNLFCQENLDIPRVRMPQMRGIPKPGTPAAQLRANKKGKVDLTQQFLQHLEEQGIASEETKIRASYLRASQNQIVGSRVVQLIEETRSGDRDLRERPIFVTRDNYVVDGHHHWVAIVVHGFDKDKDLKVPVYKLDMDIGQALDMANEFTAAYGLAPKSGDTSGNKSLAIHANDIMRQCLEAAGDDVEAGLLAAQILLSTDAQGNEHKGKGEGGGQFTSSSKSDDKKDTSDHPMLEYIPDERKRAFRRLLHDSPKFKQWMTDRFNAGDKIESTEEAYTLVKLGTDARDFPVISEIMESNNAIKTAIQQYNSFTTEVKTLHDIGHCYRLITMRPRQGPGKDEKWRWTHWTTENPHIAKDELEDLGLDKLPDYTEYLNRELNEHERISAGIDKYEGIDWRPTETIPEDYYASLNAFFAHDIFNRKAQGILNKSLQAAKGMSASARREFAAALKKGSASGEAILSLIEKYRGQLARMLTATDLAAVLEGAREVAGRVPTLAEFPGATAPPPTMEPAQALALVERLEKLDPTTRAMEVYKLPPAEQAYVNQAIAARQAPPPVVPPIVKPHISGSPDDVHLLTIENAVRDLAGRAVMDRQRYDTLESAARAKAFTVANVAAEETLTKIRDSLAKNVAEGADYETWSKKVLEDVDVGTFMSDTHQENVFRTNIQASFSDGQASVLAHPLVRSGFPYSTYDAIHDDRVRENHLALEHHGIQGTNVYRNDDPVFQMFRPPWDYMDRCAWTPITIRQAAERGILEAQEWLKTGIEPTKKAHVKMPDFRPPEGFQRIVSSSPLSVQLSMQSMAMFSFDPNEPRDKSGKWTVEENQRKTLPNTGMMKAFRESVLESAKKLGIKGVEGMCRLATLALHTIYPQGKIWTGSKGMEAHYWLYIDGKHYDVTGDQYNLPEIHVSEKPPELKNPRPVNDLYSDVSNLEFKVAKEIAERLRGKSFSLSLSIQPPEPPITDEEYPRDSSNRLLDKYDIACCARDAKDHVTLREMIPNEQRPKLDRLVARITAGGTVHYPDEKPNLGIDINGCIPDPAWQCYAWQLEEREAWKERESERQGFLKALAKIITAIREKKPDLGAIEAMLDKAGVSNADQRMLSRARHRAEVTELSPETEQRTLLDLYEDAVEATFKRIEAEQTEDIEPPIPDEPSPNPTPHVSPTSPGPGPIPFGLNAALDTDGGYWITVGGHEEGDEKHVGGFRVKINSDGTILMGRARGTNVRNLKEHFDNQRSQPGGRQQQQQRTAQRTAPQQPARFTGEYGTAPIPAGPRSRPVPSQPAPAGGGVAAQAPRPGNQGNGQVGQAQGVAANPQAAQAQAAAAAAKSIAEQKQRLSRVTKRIERYAKMFKAKGNTEEAEWISMLAKHVKKVGGDAALASLLQERTGTQEKVYYAASGAGDLSEDKETTEWVNKYLNRIGITLTPSPDLPVVSSAPLTGLKARSGKDIVPVKSNLTNKLLESKSLPGLESTEDIDKLMGVGGPETGGPPVINQLTPDVIAKFDEKYGKGGWLVKTYGSQAFAGFGVLFPQRIAEVQQNAIGTLFGINDELQSYDYDMARDESGRIVGFMDRKGNVYKFGSPELNNIGMDRDKEYDTNDLNKRLKSLAHATSVFARYEHGMVLPRLPEDSLRYDKGISLRRDEAGNVTGIVTSSGREIGFGLIKDANGTVFGADINSSEEYKNLMEEQDDEGALAHEIDRAVESASKKSDVRFMVQPAWEAVGVTEADRAMGVTWETGEEGRVHCTTIGGKASVIPYATLARRSDSMPAVFYNDDIRAMEKAVEDAINALPESERQGQVYAPDVMRTKDGWKVVELNASTPDEETGSSNWLEANPLVMDAYVSHIAQRDPAHVRFVRNLLSEKMRGSSRRGTGRRQPTGPQGISAAMSQEFEEQHPRGVDGRFVDSDSTYIPTKGRGRTVRHGSLRAKFITYKDQQINGPHIPLKNYVQMDEHSCGYVAALTLAEHFHPGVSPKKILSVIRPSVNGGIDGKTLRKRLKEIGVETEEDDELTIKSLRKHIEEGTPVLITIWPDEWISDHWVVVKGFDKDGKRIYLSNYPSMTVEDFRRQWFTDGYGLICKPADKALSVDAQGNEHRGKGPGGGQFVSQGKGGDSKKSKDNKEPLTFYRGTVPGETKRIDEPFEAARGKTFVSRHEESAKSYGGAIEKITAKDGAKILYQESPEFWKLLGKRRPPNGHIGSVKGGMIENVNRIIHKAIAEGYDAVSFEQDSDVGTVILNEDMFIRGNIGSKPPRPSKKQSGEYELETAPIKKRRKIDTGVNGVYITRLKGNRLAVFKPQAEETAGARLSIKTGTQWKREIAFYQMAKLLGSDMVPNTAKRDMSGKVGSIQDFVYGAKPASDASEDEALGNTENLAMGAALDFIALSTDRHSGNWLIDQNGGMHLIDNGLSFPTINEGEFAVSMLLSTAISRDVEIPDSVRKAARDNRQAIEDTLTDTLEEERAVELAMERLDALANPDNKTFSDVWNTSEIKIHSKSPFGQMAELGFPVVGWDEDDEDDDEDDEDDEEEEE